MPNVCINGKYLVYCGMIQTIKHTKMEHVINKKGIRFSVGQLVRMTKQCSDMNDLRQIEKVSSRFIYVNKKKFCVNSLSRGSIGNVEYIQDTNSFVTYRLKNQKAKGYKGLYAKLFRLLNKDSIFGECYEEFHSFDGDDMIVTSTWGLECECPKGITEE
tara:strand:- start:205 stop:681 length:477 start_codon:yes stop_codon:yes gene_type:complete